MNEAETTSSMYKFDVNDAVKSLKQFNEDTISLASDRLMDRIFGELEGLHDQQIVAERVVALDGLWTTQLFRQTGAAECIVQSITTNADNLICILRPLGDDDLELAPRKVIQAAHSVLRVILDPAPGSEVRIRQNYSFATKFFHWSTKRHFPIVDGRARRAINRLQRGRTGMRDGRIRSDAASLMNMKRVDEYERWIQFYSDLLCQLSKPDRYKLINVDHETSGYHHSLLRILDKVFYTDGGENGQNGT